MVNLFSIPQVNKHLTTAIRDERSLDLFRTCTSCGKKMLRDLIDNHQEYCDKRSKTPTSKVNGPKDDDDEGEEETGVVDGTTTGGEVEDVTMKENITMECPLCGRKFVGREVPLRHLKKCQEKEEREKRRAEQKEKLRDEQMVSL